MRLLWCRGPAAAPTIDFDLPAHHFDPEQQPTSIASDEPINDNDDKIYSDPRYSLNNGLDVFARYHQKHPDTAPVRILTVIGTHDLCHVGCVDMQSRLEALGKDVVRADMVSVRISVRSRYLPLLLIALGPGNDSCLRYPWSARVRTGLDHGRRSIAGMSERSGLWSSWLLCTPHVGHKPLSLCRPYTT
jgi:hypothetical protein